MPRTILSRYLNPETLNRLAGRRIDPRGLVIGNLAGSHKSPLAGLAVEFAGHREYIWGDDPKHIDWRVYYTRDRYVVKQYEMETNLVCHFLLDASASMRYGEGESRKLDYAARMIATLGYAVVRQSDKVSLAAFDEEIRAAVPPSNSVAQVIRMAELLDTLEPTGKSRMADCLSEWTARTRRSEIVMIFSDFFTDLGPLEAVLQQMRYRRHEVVLFQIMHHDELTFAFDEPTRFVGLEIPEELLVQPERLRRAYLQSLQDAQRRLGLICQRNRVERVLFDTSRDMAEVLLDYLNGRRGRRFSPGGATTSASWEMP